jgi:uncharacterized membrane protein
MADASQDTNFVGKVKEYSSRFGMPMISGFMIFFMLFLLLINIPPIPLPFTSNKLYLINQPFAEIAKFYLYVIFYFVLIYVVFASIYKFSEWALGTHKKLIKKFTDFLANLL